MTDREKALVEAAKMTLRVKGVWTVLPESAHALSHGTQGIRRLSPMLPQPRTLCRHWQMPA